MCCGLLAAGGKNGRAAIFCVAGVQVCPHGPYLLALPPTVEVCHLSFVWSPEATRRQLMSFCTRVAMLHIMLLNALL